MLEDYHVSMLDQLREMVERLPGDRARPMSELVAAPNTRMHDWQLAPSSPQGHRGEQRPAVGRSADLSRILELPRRPVPGPRELSALAAKWRGLLGRPRAPGTCACASMGRPCVDELRPAQAWALEELREADGLLGAIGVGHGKTLLNILAARAVRGVVLAVMLIPPGLRDQLARDYLALREHWQVPSLVMEGRGWTVPGSPVVHVVPYSRLSRPESSDLLGKLGPDLFVADECHKLKDPESATVRRFLRYLRERPQTRLACWSGTVTSRSVKDYAHLLDAALKEGSPLPRDPNAAQEWALALDPTDWVAPMGELERLLEPGESLYDGYRRRLHETRGVVHTSGAAVGCPVVLRARPAELPFDLAETLRRVRSSWVRPDGEEFVEHLAVQACARQLACGFFYRWKFPRGEEPALILEWYEARKEWNRELRDKLRSAREHLDSPVLCTRAAERHYRAGGYSGDLPTWEAQSWKRWEAVKDAVQPEPDAVWLSDFLAEDAADWVAKHRGVVWYEHAVFGRRVAQLSGAPLHGGGPEAGALIAAEDGSRSLVASVKAHGTGRDGLQLLFHKQLVANPPAGADAWEQLLGRLHRTGQRADEVETWVYRHTPELREALDSAVLKAKYVEGTTGAHQKLLSCDAEFPLDKDA